MRIVAVILFAIVASMTPSKAQTLKEVIAKLQETWNTPIEPFRIIGNIHYVGTAGLASYLITSPQGHILIDTGLPEANPQIKANIEKLGFKVSDIKQLLNTHAHYDHTGGLAELKRDTGAPLAASAADKPLLEGGYYPGEENNASVKFAPVKVDRIIREGDTVSVGNATVTAIMTPGHSPGGTSWIMTVKENGQDHRVILLCSVTVAINRLVGHPTHPTIVEDFRKTFARLREIKADVALAPHPEVFAMMEKRALIRDGAPNPFIKDGEFAAYAAKMERAFEDELAKQTAAQLKN